MLDANVLRGEIFAGANLTDCMNFDSFVLDKLWCCLPQKCLLIKIPLKFRKTHNPQKQIAKEHFFDVRKSVPTLPTAKRYDIAHKTEKQILKLQIIKIHAYIFIVTQSI